ncbi:MAG: very-short-patch-repair endonuclease [Saprospiraceae bacterium]|jgi:very-short-patch-repair endonuclease
MEDNGDRIRNLYGGASSRKFRFASGLRTQRTKTEILLWEKLRAKRLGGFKFRQQHPFGRFVLDFYCHSEKLSIEIDGEIHKENDNEEYDALRTKMLKEEGIQEMRFTNQEILNNIEEVTQRILQKLKDTE